jgi:hypothetical protein
MTETSSGLGTLAKTASLPGAANGTTSVTSAGSTAGAWQPTAIVGIIPNAIRANILKLFPPYLENVWAYHIPWMLNPDGKELIPEGEQTCIIYGKFESNRTQSLICEVGGKLKMPSGRPLHIVLSTGFWPGGKNLVLPSYASGDISPTLYEEVQEAKFKVSFQKIVGLQMLPQQNKLSEAAAA